jgi:hypothetical protein
MKSDTEWTLERDSETYDLRIDFEVLSWGCAATYWDPGEPMEIEIGTAWLPAPPWAKRHYQGKPCYGDMPFALSERERARVEEWLCENVEDFGPEPYDD